MNSIIETLIMEVRPSDKSYEATERLCQFIKRLTNDNQELFNQFEDLLGEATGEQAQDYLQYGFTKGIQFAG